MFYRSALSLSAFLIGFLISVLISSVFAPATNVEAATVGVDQYEEVTSVSAGVRFNNQNWFTTPHPKPESFVVTETGEVYGTTTTGIPFTQTNVPNAEGIKVQKFVIQDHYHYIIDSEVVYSLEALENKIAALQAERESGTFFRKILSFTR